MAAGGEGERSRQWDLEEEARTGSTGAEISTGEKSSIKPSHGESSQLLFTGERREREEWSSGMSNAPACSGSGE
jgi:hypothetical protein